MSNYVNRKFILASATSNDIFIAYLDEKTGNVYDRITYRFLGRYSNDLFTWDLAVIQNPNLRSDKRLADISKQDIQEIKATVTQNITNSISTNSKMSQLSLSADIATPDIFGFFTIS